jgi:hypothetical protein
MAMMVTSVVTAMTALMATAAVTAMMAMMGTGRRLWMTKNVEWLYNTFKKCQAFFYNTLNMGLWIGL